MRTTLDNRYFGLTTSCWQHQQQRIIKSAERLRQCPFTKEGIDFPDPDYEHSLSIGEGRRLNAAVMFLDISDFTARPMETPIEQDLMLRILTLFFSEMIRIAEEHDGQVEKNTGDGLMIYFTDDLSVHSTQKAVACALTMMAATTYLINPIVRLSNAEDISFRVSIDYGTVTIAKIGSPRRFSSYTAIGTIANLACKMLRHAEAEQIVLGENAKNNLPIEWQLKYTQRLPINTGWLYSATKLPYPLYLYTGRWANLI